MESLGVIGFIFGLSALAMVLQLKKTVESLKNQIEKLKDK
tara:strand:- start:1619 stop:1738 length:120 start_codon:yes stop_codon:yes gene_type:complete